MKGKESVVLVLASQSLTEHPEVLRNVMRRELASAIGERDGEEIDPAEIIVESLTEVWTQDGDPVYRVSGRWEPGG